MKEIPIPEWILVTRVLSGRQLGDITRKALIPVASIRYVEEDKGIRAHSRIFFTHNGADWLITERIDDLPLLQQYVVEVEYH